MGVVVKINGQCINAPRTGAQTVAEALQEISQPIRKHKGEILFSSGAASMMSLIREYVSFSEYLAIGVLMFAGTMWMFGHRTKAIEMLIGVVIGYEVILHAEDFIEWLKELAK